MGTAMRGFNIGFRRMGTIAFCLNKSLSTRNIHLLFAQLDRAVAGCKHVGHRAVESDGDNEGVGGAEDDGLVIATVGGPESWLDIDIAWPVRLTESGVTTGVVTVWTEVGETVDTGEDTAAELGALGSLLPLAVVPGTLTLLTPCKMGTVESITPSLCVNLWMSYSCLCLAPEVARFLPQTGTLQVVVLKFRAA